VIGLDSLLHIRYRSDWWVISKRSRCNLSIYSTMATLKLPGNCRCSLESDTGSLPCLEPQSFCVQGSECPSSRGPDGRYGSCPCILRFPQLQFHSQKRLYNSCMLRFDYHRLDFDTHQGLPSSKQKFYCNIHHQLWNLQPHKHYYQILQLLPRYKH